MVEVLSEYAIVIDLGSKHGVKVGDGFVVYEMGEMIKDPEGKDLERLELVKGRVEITHVQEAISQAQSFSVEKKTYHPLGGFNIFGPQEYTERVTHKIAEGVGKPPREVGKVKVGDLVRRVYQL